jgi:hypothetical protein
MLTRAPFLGLLLLASAGAVSRPHWVEVAGGAWHPPGPFLVKAEAALRSVVISKGGVHTPKWSDYTFQYQGRETPEGNKYIYINAFCDRAKRGEPEEWVMVYDGGACYFHGKYDPTSKRAYDVEVNGEA